MNRFLLICCLFSLLTAKVLGQQFSQYNTGTLYDSFENPSQRSFIPDSSRRIAFNFFIPNFDANLYIRGNAQDALIKRIFEGYYDTGSLTVGQSNYNNVNTNVNAYAIMLKLFISMNGNQEVGFFAGTKAESRGLLTDESVAIFNGAKNFTGNFYNNIFNDNYYYQLYHQIGFTYREQVTPKFALGIKLSALSGITYREASIDQSSIFFDKANDQATLSMQGISRSSGGVTPGLRFANPGAAISIGTTYVTADGYRFQYNLKDLGFIYWGNEAVNATFRNDNALITGLSTPEREKNIFDKVADITTGSQVKTGFYTKTDARAEISVNKNYWLDYDRQFKLSPTIIVSKELFYQGFTGALVAPVQYKNYVATLTTSYLSSAYTKLGVLSFGGQAMIKSPNAEFFIGTESLMQTGRSILAVARGKSSTQAQTTTPQRAFSGANFFIGASFKFGSVIEHPMNASWVPTGDENRGFFGRLYDKIFKKDNSY